MKRIPKSYDSLERKCAEIAEYNKEHGTNYSYGQHTALVRLGKIKHQRKKRR